MDLGTRLAKQRKKYGFTQLQLSQVMNMSQQVISNYERNVSTPPIDFLEQLADIYKITIDELIGRQVKFDSESTTLERQIMEIIQSLNDNEKELSLSLVSTVAKHRGQINDK